MIRAFVVALAIGQPPTPVLLRLAFTASGNYSPNCTEAHQDGRYDIPQGDPDLSAMAAIAIRQWIRLRDS